MSAAETFPAQVPLSRALRIGLRSLGREWRSGELRVLAFAVLLAVASIVSVSAFTDRLDRSLELGATDLLAADLIVRAHTPLAERFETTARERGLATARVLSFRSVIPAGENLQLGEIKAVSDDYPLRGQLEKADAAFTAGVPSGPPERGTVWLDSQLATLLELSPGERITLGRGTTLSVAAIITAEPDRGGDVFNIAPRLMMHIDDIAATGLIAPGSHVHYRTLIAGEPDEVADFREWIEPELTPNESVEGIRDARPALRVALERGQRFLGLASLVAVMLAGVAIGLATRRYAERHLDAAAIMRCLGADQRAVLVTFAALVLALGLGASVLGAAIGYAAQEGLASLVGKMLVAELPAPSLMPMMQGLAAGMVLVAGFALPPIARLRQVAPARVIRRDLGGLPASAALGYLGAALAFGALVLWQAGDRALAGWVLGGGLATVVVLALAALALVRIAGALRGQTSAAWRYGLANIARHKTLSITQIVAVGVGIMVLLLLTIVRNDLLADWRDTVPDDAPNYFMINVQPHEVDPVRELLARENIESSGLRAMVRGRLTQIDGEAVDPESYTNPRARRLAEREFNLSFAADMQVDNRVAEGRWFTEADHGQPVASVEVDLARTLGLEVGDRIVFSIAGEPIEVEIVGLRTVEWDSFRTNFFVLFPPGVIEDRPGQYITAFHLPDGQERTLIDLVRQFPGITVLDIDSLLEKIRTIMDRANAAVRYVFGFTVLAGLVVMFAAIQSTQDERRRQSALLRTLGASRQRVRSGLLAEFASLGLLAGALGAIAATGIGWAVAVYLFRMEYAISPFLWLLGLAGGGLGVMLAGWLGTRAVLDNPPAATLREAT